MNRPGGAVSCEAAVTIVDARDRRRAASVRGSLTAVVSTLGGPPGGFFRLTEACQSHILAHMIMLFPILSQHASRQCH